MLFSLTCSECLKNVTNIFAYFISQKEREYNITHIEIDFNFCKIFSLSTNFGNHITEIDFSCYKFLFFSPPILVITSPKLILIFFSLLQFRGVEYFGHINFDNHVTEIHFSHLPSLHFSLLSLSFYSQNFGNGIAKTRFPPPFSR